MTCAELSVELESLPEVPFSDRTLVPVELDDRRSDNIPEPRDELLRYELLDLEREQSRVVPVDELEDRLEFDLVLSSRGVRVEAERFDLDAETQESSDQEHRDNGEDRDEDHHLDDPTRDREHNLGSSAIVASRARRG